MTTMYSHYIRVKLQESRMDNTDLKLNALFNHAKAFERHTKASRNVKPVPQKASTSTTNASVNAT